MFRFAGQLAIVMGLLCSNFANADTISYEIGQKVSVEEGFNLNSKWITLDVPKFDNKLGKLTSLTFSSLANYDFDANVDMRSAIGGLMIAYGVLSSEAALFGYNPVVKEFPISGFSTIPANVMLPSEVVYAGSNWSAHLSGSWSVSETISNPITLSYISNEAESYYIQYYGAFAYSFESFIWGFDGPYTLDVTGGVDYKYFVTYNYTSAVPEGSVWMMLIAGLAGVGLLTRRRRKTRDLPGCA